MKKITKRHYNRKLLIFGLMLFISIAMVSTGFAAWVMSNGAEATDQGGVQIGVVKDGNLTFSNVGFKKEGDEEIKDFIFEPASTDNTGNIRPEFDDQGNVINPENLTVTIIGTISPVEFLDTVTVSIKLPDGVVEAILEGYLEAPKCAINAELLAVYNEDDDEDNDLGPVTIIDNGAALTVEGLTYTANSSSISFEYDIAIGWGTKFYDAESEKCLNPSIYLDEHTTLKFEQKRAILAEFRQLVYDIQEPTYVGTTEEDKEKERIDHYCTFMPAENALPVYEVTLTAVPN